MRRLLSVVVCVTAMLVSGCGYTTRSMISSKFHTVYITPFTSSIDITGQGDSGTAYRIYRPGLESEMTRSLSNKFLFDGNVKPSTKENSDLIFHGELVEFRRDALRYTSSDDVEEYRLNIVVNISLWDRRENKMLWEEKGFTGDTSYFTRGPAVKAEAVAVSDAINDLSQRIVARVVEEW